MATRIYLDVNYCKQCPFCQEKADPDPNDWFEDDDALLFCRKADMTIVSGLRPYELDKVEVPTNCPFNNA